MAAPIDAAIAAAEARSTAPSWAGKFVLPSSGRPVQLVVPADLTPMEALEIVAFVTTELPRQLQSAAARRPRILVPQ